MKMSKNKCLREILLSDENIYKSILSLESYLFNPQLLSDCDMKLLNELNDKFNYDLLFVSDVEKMTDSLDELDILSNILSNGGLIEYVRRRISRVIDPEDNTFFESTVNFKIKNLSEEKYRPLHSASLIDNIAMVSMLQILIYDMNEDSTNTKMKLSNLSKLIPYNFYGNIPSRSPERLFEKWQTKYKEYSEITNEKFSKYHETGEYKTEIVLDLENFFPSVNPQLVFDFIIKSLEVRYSEDDLDLIKIVTFKLLTFEIVNFDNKSKKIFEKKYYENDIDSYLYYKNNKGVYLSKGIPQGLPQSYFFGNLIMVNVSKRYKNVFDGEMFFYVDDSVIYLKQEVDDDRFIELLARLNRELSNYSKKISHSTNIYFEECFSNIDFSNNRKNQRYNIKVHSKGKSHFQLISDTKIGYKYLLFMSRLASMGSFDMVTTFDDNQEVQLSKKFETVITAIEKEIEMSYKKLEELTNKKECGESNCENCKKTCVAYNNYHDYITKLSRFKKFFQYRVFQVQMQESEEAFQKVIDDLIELNTDELLNELDSNILEIKLSIINQMLLKKTYIGTKNLTKISDIYCNLKNLELSPYENEKAEDISSIFYYNVVFNKDREVFREKKSQYKTLENISSKLAISANKHKTYQIDELDKLLKLIHEKRIVEFFFENDSIADSKNREKLKSLIYWSKKSRYLRRLIYNALISRNLGLELNDNFFVTRKSKKLLNYYELRIALVVRNSNINTTLLVEVLKEYLKEYKANKSKFKTIDYTIFEAIYYFKTFARDAKYIDNLILTHKYTADLWENGSKYMHFYTLHNQSHAIELIENTNRIMKSVDFLKVSKMDYYILYAACYLHDIAMVLYPNYDKFYDPKWESANKIVENHISRLNKINPLASNDYLKLKDHILDLYKEIETIFEKEVRDKHATNSAMFIRKSKDLDFFDSGVIDHIADVSNAHGVDARDVYHLKSNASERKISLKFMMILLRLSDLLDMNENRVSIPIFYNNKRNMSETSKFHWISHLITGGFKFNSEYKLNEKEDTSYLRPRAISETITLQIDINIDQLTTIETKKSKKCNNVKMKNYLGGDSVILDIRNSNEKCDQKKCNFICKWFNTKNGWLINELSNLQSYINDVHAYFDTSFEIELVLNDSTILRPEDFDDLKEYITKN